MKAKIKFYDKNDIQTVIRGEIIQEDNKKIVITCNGEKYTIKKDLHIKIHYEASYVDFPIVREKRKHNHAYL